MKTPLKIKREKRGIGADDAIVVGADDRELLAVTAATDVETDDLAELVRRANMHDKLVLDNAKLSSHVSWLESQLAATKGGA